MYKILLVDDEVTIREGIKNAIPWSEWGFEVIGTCENGQKAIEMIEKNPPDVVLSDVKMPILDGVGLMKHLKANFPSIKVVILSGYNDFEYLNASIKNDVIDYLLKPSEIDDFKETFTRIKNKIDDEKSIKKSIIDAEEISFKKWLNLILQGNLNVEIDEKTNETIEKHNINFENMRILAISLDDRNGDDKKNLYSLKEKISLFFIEENCYSFISFEEYIVVIYSKKDYDKINLDDLTRFIKSNQNNIKSNLGVSVSVGISENFTSITRLLEAYEQAKCCSNQKVFNGFESVFEFEQIKTTKPKNTEYFNTDLIENSILDNNYDVLEGEIYRVFNSYVGFNTKEYGFFDNLCTSLIFHIYLWALKYDINAMEILGKLGAKYQDIILCDTLEKKREFLLALLFSIQMSLAKKLHSKDGTNSIGYQILACIEEDYLSNAISIEYLSQKTGKSPSYISKYFKNELGTNFSSYILKKRMLKAQELLLNSNSKIYEIAETCGYADVSNFIKVFKKFFNKSPNEYRNEVDDI